MADIGIDDGLATSAQLLFDIVLVAMDVQVQTAGPLLPAPFALVTLLGSTDLFAVVGAVVPIALSIAALRKTRPQRTFTQPVRRAASALHGESNWRPLDQATRFFDMRAVNCSTSPRCRPASRRPCAMLCSSASADLRPSDAHSRIYLRPIAVNGVKD